MSGKPEIRIGKMADIGGVITEMGRVYRQMRRGDLDTLDGKRLVDVLTAIRQAMEVQDVEARLRALEGRL